MSDFWIVCLGISACTGAMWAYGDHKYSIFAGLFALLVARILRSPLLFCLAMLLVTSALSAHAWAQLSAPFPSTVSALATLVKDPEFERGGAVRVEAKINNRHVDMWAHGQLGTVLRNMLAGEHVKVEGDAAPLSGLAAPSLRRRHIAARINVTAVSKSSDGSLFAKIPNYLRRTFESGSVSLPRDERALLSGFVLGDQRNESVKMKKEFQDSGLSHLLAVSGANVAFVLLICAPIIKCFELRGRLLLGFCVLALFGALTRWEPSVMRAEAMAAVVMYASFLGRSASSWRVLSLATVLCILIDPFLVGSIGFLLSLGACVGMFLFGSRFATIIPGPRWFARCVGFSAGAQIGVAPVQLVVFGDLPVVSLFANVLAEPVAGIIMTWGITAGLFAGLFSGIFQGRIGWLLHLPTRWLLEWVELVARNAALISKHLGSWNLRLLWCAVLVIALMFWFRLRPSYGQMHERNASGISSEGR